MTNNLSYETAKSLKEAGFPQAAPYTVYLQPPDNLQCKNGEWVYVPSLSELIDACGEKFWSVSKSHAVLSGEREAAPWKAKSWDLDGGIEVSGASPSEACANLYLALHNK